MRKMKSICRRFVRGCIGVLSCSLSSMPSRCYCFEDRTRRSMLGDPRSCVRLSTAKEVDAIGPRAQIFYIQIMIRSSTFERRVESRIFLTLLLPELPPFPLPFPIPFSRLLLALFLLASYPSLFHHISTHFPLRQFCGLTFPSPSASRKNNLSHSIPK